MVAPVVGFGESDGFEKSGPEKMSRDDVRQERHEKTENSQRVGATDSPDRRYRPKSFFAIVTMPAATYAQATLFQQIRMKYRCVCR